MAVGSINYRGHTPAVNLSMGCSNMGSLDEHMSCNTWLVECSMIIVASSPGHSQILSPQLRDKIWEWPGYEAMIIA